MFLLTLFAESIPLMKNYLMEGHDLKFHLMRIEGLSAGLAQGIFPVRIQPEWLDGHGYAVSVFYGDVFFCLPAILHIFGVTVYTAYKLYVLLIHIATACISYHCFSKMSNRNIGLLCSMVYSLNIYRLTCIYTRAAVGEYTAMAFLPLLVYGLWKIYTLPEDSKEHERSFVTLAVGCSGVFMSHMISTEIAAFFIVLLCVVQWKKTFRRKTMLVLAKSAGMTVLLCLWFLVPFLDFMMNGEYRINAVNSFAYYRMEDRGAFAAQLFMNVYNSTDFSGIIPYGAAGQMPLTIGYASMAALAGWFFFCPFRKERDKKEKREEYFAVFLMSGSLLLATCLVPYARIIRRIPALRMVIESLQYPWRFLSAAGIFAVYLLCLLMQKSWIEKRRKMIFAVLLLSMAFCQSYSYLSSFMKESVPRESVSEFAIIGGEYMPRSYQVEDYKNELTYDRDVITLEEWHRVRGGVEFSLINHANEVEQVEVPLLLYRGYQAVTGTGEALAVQAGKSSRISVSVPSGFRGTVRVVFREPWYWRGCEVISFLAAVGLLYFLWADRCRKRG